VTSSSISYLVNPAEASKKTKEHNIRGQERMPIELELELGRAMRRRRAEEAQEKERQEEVERTSLSESLFGEKNGGGGLVSDSGNELVVDNVDLDWWGWDVSRENEGKKRKSASTLV